MPLPAWPEDVPDRPISGGLQPAEPYRPPLVTEVEDGPEIMRVRSQTVVRKFAYSIVMTAAQFAAWDDFATVTLGQGTSRFTMSVGLLGAGYAIKTCWLEGGTWRAEPHGARTLVSFVLCVLMT